MIPAITTARRNVGKAPNSWIADKTITASPAAGPLTPRGEPLIRATTVPPTIPAMMPENRGAPDANAIPRQSGTATRNTTILAGISYFKFLNRLVLFIRVNLMIKTNARSDVGLG